MAYDGLMWIRSDDFVDGEPIPGRNAFCVYDPGAHVTFSSNLSPHLCWGEAPAGTRSFALMMIDVDVPSKGDDVNQEGREVPPDLVRTDFTHWLIADIGSDVTEFGAGQFCNGVTPGGKPGLRSGPVEGLNDYTGWFAGDADMAGKYRGYDGPCPPWNDSLIHHYVFTIFALDVESVGLGADFTAEDLQSAATGHILAEASLTGTYTLNPALF